MENFRDLAYEGWMSKTSRKGKGPGRSKGTLFSGEGGSKEDRSWGKESVKLRERIWKELGHSEVEVSAEAEAGVSGLQGSFNEEDSVVEERLGDETRSEDEDKEGGSEEGEAESMEIKVVDEERKNKKGFKGRAADEKKVKNGERTEERREEEKGRERWRSRIRSGFAGQVWRRDARVGSRSRSRSRRRRGSGSDSRYGSGLRLGSRRVCFDEEGIRIQGEKLSRDKEALGEEYGQGPRSKESQQFQQFKVIQLCVREIRKRMEEFFCVEEVPRRSEEALVMCEREIDERIGSLRMLLGASTLVRDLEVVGGAFSRDCEVRKWKKSVMEAMEERIRRRNLGAGQEDREKRRMDGLSEGWTGRREISKDRKSERGEYRTCYGCGDRGHLKKDCKGNKKDNGPRGRDL